MVVIDPTWDNQPAFERALESAHMTGARLHLYACLNDALGRGGKEATETYYCGLLEGLADQSENRGVEASVESDWGDDWPRQVIAAAARCSASMVFKNSFVHSNVQREMRHTSDWTLMRLCPCPVLMVKNVQNWEKRRVLAAVDSQSMDEAHIKLNTQIVSFTQQFVDAYGSDAHFVCAYTDRNNRPETGQLSAAYGVPKEYIHTVEGSAYDVITEISHKIAADLVIIGTVGRSGIKGQIIGNTSERILDHTASDVLVIN